MDTSLTLVTGFWDIYRENWHEYSRPKSMYFNNAKRMLTIKHPLIIFIQPKFVNWVKGNRKQYSDYTIIVPLEITSLHYFNLKDKIKSIMDSESYKKGLADKSVPEVWNPFYDIVIWSKLPLVVRAIKMNPFNSTHFGWIDFGIHTHGLKDYHLHTKILSNVPNNIRILAISKPESHDLVIEKFFKSHKPTLLATVFTGSTENIIKFDKMADEVILQAIKLNVVDCEQSIYAICYLKNPSMFDLYYGNYSDLVDKYSVKKNNFSIHFFDPNIQKNNYKFWAIIFENSNALSIYREDADINEINLIKNNRTNGFYIINRSFTSTVRPTVCIIWPYSELNGWENKIIVPI